MQRGHRAEAFRNVVNFDERHGGFLEKILPCSPDGAERNPGSAQNLDSAPLHPGYPETRRDTPDPRLQTLDAWTPLHHLSPCTSFFSGIFLVLGFCGCSAG